MAKGSLNTDLVWNFNKTTLDGSVGFPGGHVSLKKGSGRSTIPIFTNLSSTPITDLQAGVGAIDELTDMAVVSVSADLFINVNGAMDSDPPGRVSSRVKKVKYYDSTDPGLNFVHTFSIPEYEPSSGTPDADFDALVGLFKPFGANTKHYVIG